MTSRPAFAHHAPDPVDAARLGGPGVPRLAARRHLAGARPHTPLLGAELVLEPRHLARPRRRRGLRARRPGRHRRPVRSAGRRAPPTTSSTCPRDVDRLELIAGDDAGPGAAARRAAVRRVDRDVVELRGPHPRGDRRLPRAWQAQVDGEACWTAASASPSTTPGRPSPPPRSQRPAARTPLAPPRRRDLVTYAESALLQVRPVVGRAGRSPSRRYCRSPPLVEQVRAPASAVVETWSRTPPGDLVSRVAGVSTTLAGARCSTNGWPSRRYCRWSPAVGRAGAEVSTTLAGARCSTNGAVVETLVTYAAKPTWSRGLRGSRRRSPGLAARPTCGRPKVVEKVWPGPVDDPVFGVGLSVVTA